MYQLYCEPSPRDTTTERVEGFEECTNYAGFNSPRGGPKEDTNKMGVWPAERTICTGAGPRDVPAAQGRAISPVAQRGMRMGACRCGATALAVLCCAVRGFVPEPELADQRPR